MTCSWSSMRLAGATGSTERSQQRDEIAKCVGPVALSPAKGEMGAQLGPLHVDIAHPLHQHLRDRYRYDRNTEARGHQIHDRRNLRRGLGELRTEPRFATRADDLVVKRGAGGSG